MKNDHRPRVEVPGVGTWTLESPGGEIEFIRNQDAYARTHAPLQKALSTVGVPVVFVDPGKRFIIVDAQDELLRGDAATGELKSVASLTRMEDRGFRRATFVTAQSTSSPVFIYELGIIVFDVDGLPLWSRADFKLDHHFERIEDGRIIYSSEHRGQWSYDLFTGRTSRLPTTEQ